MENGTSRDCDPVGASADRKLCAEGWDRPCKPQPHASVCTAGSRRERDFRPQEDWRYTEQREQLGRHFWWASWVTVFMAQSTFMFAGCLSLYPVRSYRACSRCGVDVYTSSVATSDVQYSIIVICCRITVHPFVRRQCAATQQTTRC